MRLRDLESYDTITIQTHDNPDADAIASGFALYSYFKGKIRQVSLIYSGRNKIQKTDLRLMVEKLGIPIRYRAPEEAPLKGLLITVDCQYGAGNISSFQAESVVVIDHHQQEVATDGLTDYEIVPNLGSCSTLVWRLLMEERYPVNDNIKVGTALYYGLYRDTSQFTELYYPLDRDMREAVSFDKGIMYLLKNSNLSLKELEIAGIALIRYIYNRDFHYAIIRTHACDPNLLGLISDFLIQVDEIHTCVVYNHVDDGYKFSVRSCIREVNASEFAQYLSQGIGSGGGHAERAGGFLYKSRYDRHYPALNGETYFGNKMKQYFESFDIIDGSAGGIETAGMERYEGRQETVGFVKASTLLPAGTQCFIRTIDGDVQFLIDEKRYILIDDSGRVKVISEEQFNRDYEPLSGSFEIKLEYTPRLKDRTTNEFKDFIQRMQPCTSRRAVRVLVRQLSRGVKVFTSKTGDAYLLGNPGDYMVVSCEDTQDVSIVEQSVFQKLYRRL
ncbi:MAG: DHH family phosphoesterase [Roseburia sp.]|nr:DHH family phosphoesterase [Roseburia sp.]